MKTTSFALGVAALAAVLCSSVCAEKITVDPNKNGGSTTNLEVKESVPDARIAKKITYTSTDKRLHTVLEELSKETGVDIQSGKNADDWPVRDIPLVVCVKDISLGKLMRAIADATHLALSASTVKDVKHYRIWRNPTRQDQLSEYFKNLEEAKNARLSAQWDAWGKLKGNDVSINSTIARSTADVMAALPAGSKEAVMAGKMLTFDIKSASPRLAQALKVYYQNLGEYAKARYESLISETHAEGERSWLRKPPRDMTEAEIEKLKFAVGSQRSYFESMDVHMSMGRGDYDSPSGLYVGLAPGYKIEDNGLDSSPISGSYALGTMGEKDPLSALDPPVTDFSRSMRKLDAEYSDLADLDKTFKIPKPKDGAERAFADLIVDIAKASGFSIVCEDFLSHRQYNMSQNFPFYDMETTLKALLLPPADSFGRVGYLLPLLNVEWLLDPAGKMLVGWHLQWWVQHRSLAPEKVIAGLIKKMNGDGLEIDDVAATLLLPKDQYSEWIVGHKNLSYRVQSGLSGNNPTFWKMYAELSAENKALAKSKDGLPLAKLKRADVLEVFGECARKMESMGEMGKLMAVGNWMRARPDMEARMEAWAMQKYPQMNPENSDASADSTPEMPPDIAEMLKSLIETFPEVKVALEPPPTDPAKVLKLKMRLAKVDFGGS
ncbi:MAG: hypothetical protein NT018_08040, partial [Armatimonadetes bacterium]|nr:hypothetical protein [Armatimonadota bacterium]